MYFSFFFSCLFAMSLHVYLPRTHIRRPPCVCTRRLPCTRTRGAPGSLQAAHSRGREKTPRKKIAPPLRRPEPNGRTGRPLPCTGRGSPPRPTAPLGDPAAPVQPRARPGGLACQPPHPAKRHPAPTLHLHLHLHRAHTAVTANRRPRGRRKGTGRLPCTQPAPPADAQARRRDLPATRTGHLPCTHPAPTLHLPCTYPAPAQSPSAAGPAPSRATHGRPQPRRPSRKGTELPTLHLAPGAHQTGRPRPRSRTSGSPRKARRTGELSLGNLGEGGFTLSRS